MPLPSPPLTFACLRCDWTWTTPGPVGDCRIEGLDHFPRCPRCAGPVRSREAGLLDRLRALLARR